MSNIISYSRRTQMHYKLQFILRDSHCLVLALSPTYVIISCRIAYWSWQIQSLCFSMIITHRSEPHTPGYVMAFRHEGHNHGSYRRSNNQTKASDTLPGIILSVPEKCNSLLPPSRKRLCEIQA